MCSARAARRAVHAHAQAQVLSVCVCMRMCTCSACASVLRHTAHCGEGSHPRAQADVALAHQASDERHEHRVEVQQEGRSRGRGPLEADELKREACDEPKCELRRSPQQARARRGADARLPCVAVAHRPSAAGAAGAECGSRHSCQREAKAVDERDWRVAGQGGPD